MNTDNKLNELAKSFKDISMTVNVFMDDKQKKKLLKLLDKMPICPFCNQEIGVEKGDTFDSHIDDYHNHIGVRPVLDKIQELIAPYTMICFKIFALKYMADIQSDRVPPGKSLAEKFKEILLCISKLSSTTLEDVNK